MSNQFDEGRIKRASDGKFAEKPHEEAPDDIFSESPDDPVVAWEGTKRVGDVRDEHGNAHPAFEVTYSNDHGETHTVSYMGSVGMSEPDPDEVLAIYCADYRTVIEDCGGDYDEYKANFGIDDDDEDCEADDVDPDTQSDEWRSWKSEYDKAREDAQAAMDDDPDLEFDDAYAEADDLWSREPERISEPRRQFENDVKKLEEFREFIGDDYDRYLSVYDEEM